MKKKSNTIKHKVVETLKTIILATMFYVGAALLFLGSGIGRSYMVKQNAQVASKTITVRTADKNKKVKTTYDAKKTKSIDAQEIWRAKQYPAYAIGRMSVPVVNIHNPLFAGFGGHNQNLSYGVVTVVPGRTMGGINNYVLAGHYMGSAGPAILDNLHYMKAGDPIYVTDMHKIYAYQTKSVSYSIKPTQIEVENNQKGKGTITLITCSDFNISRYGYGQHRTVVQGDLIGSLPATKSNLEKTELTDKANQSSIKIVKHTKVLNPFTKKMVTVRKPAQTKIYQNVTYNQIKAVFSVIVAVIVLIRLLFIWITRKNKIA